MKLDKYLTAGAIGTAVTLLVACGGSPPNKISSAAEPGNAIISFPNSPDRVNTTLILSKPAAQVAGVDGRTLTVTSVTFDKPDDKLTIDADGSMGLHGSYHSSSTRGEKKDIRPFRDDALGLLERTHIVTFRYRGESERSAVHVGLVADDTPLPLTDADRRSFDLNNSLAVTMAATRQLNARIRLLEAQMASLRSEMRELKTRKRGARAPSSAQ